MLKSAFLRFAATVLKVFRKKYFKLFYKEDDTVTLKMIHGVSADFHKYGDIVTILHSDQHLVKYKKSFEYSTLDLFSKLIKPDWVVLDIGANIGLFSILASKITNDRCTVYAIEPTKKTFDFLKKNIALNQISSVHPRRLAFSDSIMKVNMEAPGNRNKLDYEDSFNQIRYVEEGNSDEYSIETSLLDDFISEEGISKVDLIKIDIEGAELLCFKGGKKLLTSTNRPIIIFECFEKGCVSFDHDSFDVLKVLNSYGYRIRQYEYSQWIAIPLDKNIQSDFIEELINNI